MKMGDRIDLVDYQKIQQGLSCAKVGILYLLLTDACNLACRYCFVENAMPEGYSFSQMKEATVKAGIDKFAESLKSSHGIEEPQIIFYGGEPLLNLSALEHGLDYINSLIENGNLPEETSMTVNTNGTLINKKVVEIFKRARNLNVAISLDGPAQIHDFCRPFHDKRGSYTEIMRGYKLLKDCGIDAGFCCTISRHNVFKLREIANWFVNELGSKSLVLTL